MEKAQSLCQWRRALASGPDADLQANGVRCWFAPHHMQPGKKVHEQIDAAIRVYDRLLLMGRPDHRGNVEPH